MKASTRSKVKIAEIEADIEKARQKGQDGVIRVLTDKLEQRKQQQQDEQKIEQAARTMRATGYQK